MVKKDSSRLSVLPAIDALIQRPEFEDGSILPREILMDLVRAEVETWRQKIQEGEALELERPELEERILGEIKRRARSFLRPSLVRVINATGVVVHTNLGRSRLSPRALDSLRDAAGSYVNLELDLVTGKRQRRGAELFARMAIWLGTDRVQVVNNNAAAVWLSVSVLGAGKRVLVSRGELVEIGGSFRLPDILSLTGCDIVEVGTTNRTRISDYERAIRSSGDLLLKVHPSNYAVRGFTEETTLEELSRLGSERSCPVIYDLGSGSLVDLEGLGLPGEPTAKKELARGADLVTMSGDKLWGGPQAGIIAGKSELVERVAVSPLARIVRVDKLTLAALEATLIDLWSNFDSPEEIPTTRDILRSPDEIEGAAKRLYAGLVEGGIDSGAMKIEAGDSAVGGGSYTELALPSRMLTLRLGERRATRIQARLRVAATPIFVRVKGERILIDPRTVTPLEERALIEGLLSLLADEAE